MIFCVDTGCRPTLSWSQTHTQNRFRTAMIFCVSFRTAMIFCVDTGCRPTLSWLQTHTQNRFRTHTQNRFRTGIGTHPWWNCACGTWHRLCPWQPCHDSCRLLPRDREALPLGPGKNVGEGDGGRRGTGKVSESVGTATGNYTKSLLNWASCSHARPQPAAHTEKQHPDSRQRHKSTIHFFGPKFDLLGVGLWGAGLQSPR